MSDIECPICYDEYSAGNPGLGAVDVCRHTNCMNCWYVRINDRRPPFYCAICRADVSEWAVCRFNWHSPGAPLFDHSDALQYQMEYERVLIALAVLTREQLSIQTRAAALRVRIASVLQLRSEAIVGGPAPLGLRHNHEREQRERRPAN